MLVASPVFLLFIWLGRVEQGIGVWICVGIVIAVIVVRWDLRGSIWFWLAVSVAGVLQIPFVVFVPWMNRHMSFVSFLPFGALDYIIVYGCIKLAENKIHR